MGSGQREGAYAVQDLEVEVAQSRFLPPDWSALVLENLTIQGYNYTYN